MLNLKIDKRRNIKRIREELIPISWIGKKENLNTSFLQ